MKKIVGVLLLVLSVACGGGNSITGNSGVPEVAGHYTGSLTWTASGYLVTTLGTTMNVVQSGSQLTITGSISIQGQTISIPAYTGVINETGFFQATAGGASLTGVYTDCGYITPIGTTLTFSGRSASYNELSSTTLCGNWQFSGTLQR